MTSAASTAPTIPAVPAVTRKDRRLTVDVWAPTAHGSSDFRSDMVASACVVLACETAPGNHSDRLYAGIRWCSSVIRDDRLCVLVAGEVAPPPHNVRLMIHRGGSSCALVHSSRWSGSSDRKSTRLNSSHVAISYAVFC